jgi:hypothetical protein
MLNSETLTGDINDPDEFHLEIDASDMLTDHV